MPGKLLLSGKYGCLYSYEMKLLIKTHDSESQGQQEAGRTRRTSELFTCI